MPRSTALTVHLNSNGLDQPPPSSRPAPSPSSPFRFLSKNPRTLAAAPPNGSSSFPPSPPQSPALPSRAAKMNVKGGGRIPVPPTGAGALAKVAVIGGAAVYAAMNSLYNVEGGHRGIVFNRIQGIKDKVRIPLLLPFLSLCCAPLLCTWMFDGWLRVNDLIIEVSIGGEMLI
jgi:hypothetical protein